MEFFRLFLIILLNIYIAIVDLVLGSVLYLLLVPAMKLRYTLANEGEGIGNNR